MTPLELIAEWRKGCSCAPAGKPEECQACTAGLISALELWLRKPLWERIWLRSLGNLWLQRFRAWRAFVHHKLDESPGIDRVIEVQQQLLGTSTPLGMVCTPTELDSHAFRNHLDLFARQCFACKVWHNAMDVEDHYCMRCNGDR
jgi:hypothetical protein